MKALGICILLFLAAVVLNAQKNQVSLIDQDSMALNQEGRTSLLVTNSLLGLYYGGALSSIAQFEDEEKSIATYLLTAGASFLIPATLTRKKNITKSDAILCRYGQTRGILHGFLISDLLGMEWFSRGSFAFSLVGSISEGISGYLVAEKNAFSSGRSATIGLYGDFGMGVGLLSYETLDLDQRTLLDACLLAGSVSGLTIGHKLTQLDNYTRGDAYMLAGIGALGAYIPFSLMTLFPDADPRYVFLASDLGMLGSLYEGHALARKLDFSSKDGLLIGLSESAGGLMGAGIGVLIGADLDVFDKAKSISIFTGLGALTGFVLTTSAFSKKSQAKGVSSSNDVSFNFHLNPMGLSHFAGFRQSRRKKADTPVLTAQVRF